MAIPTQTTTSTPFAKLVEIGDTIVGAYGGSLVRQMRNFKSGEAEWKDTEKTKPRQEEVLWLVAMPGTTAKVGNVEKGDLAPIEAEAVIRYAVSGFKWGQVIEARNNLPAAFGFRAGQTCSSDVYGIRLIGWSASTENAEGARKAGFTVVDGRIQMRSQEDKEKYVLARARANQPTGVGTDLEITVRRIDQATEKRFEQLADELYMSKPWEQTASTAPAAEYTPAGPHPADSADWEEPF